MRPLNLAVLALGVMATAAHAQQADALCAEAADRYREIFRREAAAEPDRTVLMYKYRFCPAVVRIRPGDRLRYINVDKRTTHSVWLKDAGQPESDRAFPEGVIEIDTRLPVGEHKLLCGPHWQSDHMVGTIIVEN